MLQDGRLRVRFSVWSLNSWMYLIFPALLLPYGWLLLGSKALSARKAENFYAIYGRIVYKMWALRRLAMLWVTTTCYKDRFTSFFTLRLISLILSMWQVRSFCCAVVALKQIDMTSRSVTGCKCPIEVKNIQFISGPFSTHKTHIRSPASVHSNRSTDGPAEWPTLETYCTMKNTVFCDVTPCGCWVASYC
jgi:hypothetical protein